MWTGYELQRSCFVVKLRAFQLWPGKGRVSLLSSPWGGGRDPIFFPSCSSCTPPNQAACWWEWKSHSLSPARSREREWQYWEEWQVKRKIKIPSFRIIGLVAMVTWPHFHLFSWTRCLGLPSPSYGRENCLHIFPCSSHIVVDCPRILCFSVSIPSSDVQDFQDLAGWSLPKLTGSREAWGFLYNKSRRFCGKPEGTGQETSLSQCLWNLGQTLSVSTQVSSFLSSWWEYELLQSKGYSFCSSTFCWNSTFSNMLTNGVFGDCLQVFYRLLNLQPDFAFWHHADKSNLLHFLLLLASSCSFPNFIFGLRAISLSSWLFPGKWRLSGWLGSFIS